MAKRPERDILTDAELSKMRAECATPLEIAVFEFLRSTGCRVHEMTSIFREDLKLEEKLVFLHKTKAIIVWGKKTPDGKRPFEVKMDPRYAILDDNAVGAIKRYLKTVDLKPKSRVFDRTTRAIQKMVKRWAQNAKIDRAELVHPHLFRATTSTQMLMDNVSLPVIKQALGWSPKSQTFESNYNKLPRDAMRDIVLERRKKGKRKRANANASTTEKAGDNIGGPEEK